MKDDDDDDEEDDEEEEEEEEHGGKIDPGPVHQGEGEDVNREQDRFLPVANIARYGCSA